MCDPVTIGGIALQGASMLANKSADSKVEKARRSAMTAERIRQTGLDREAEALNHASRDRYNNFGEQQADKSVELGDFFKTQNEALPAESAGQSEPMPTSSSNIVVQERAKQQGKAKAFSDQQAGALGDLRAFGDLLGGISLKQGSDAAQIGSIGGFKRGSANVLPLELEGANAAGDKMKMFGDILGGVGSLATGAGIAKGGYNLFGIGGPSTQAITDPAQKLAFGDRIAFNTPRYGAVY